MQWWLILWVVHLYADAQFRFLIGVVRAILVGDAKNRSAPGQLREIAHGSRLVAAPPMFFATSSFGLLALRARRVRQWR